MLAKQLSVFTGKQALVLGIPRGGMVVAKEIAKQLDADLDIILSRKLRSPGQPELAFGAVSEDGQVLLNLEIVQLLHISDQYIEYEKTIQLEEINRRSHLFRSIRPKVSLEGRTVIVVDDGVATGATFKSALSAARIESPGRLIAAIPLAPLETVVELAAMADEVVCLRSPAVFSAVGQFYGLFEQLKEADVENILREYTGH
ncbi:phosphoribosyl transferase domain protein [Dehalogenimonas sp. WBC-2]|nr:phosphoribosyl transferase domain protein [Dehalogenimonas sp. WBC-2]